VQEALPGLKKLIGFASAWVQVLFGPLSSIGSSPTYLIGHVRC
jgi:hypothetical protein